MAIRHTCSCGAQIKLADSAAGRKAKCKSCGTIFLVPQPAQKKSAATTVSAGKSDNAMWNLDDLAVSESQAIGDATLPVFDLNSDPPQPASTPAHSPTPPRPREDRDWIIDPKQSFWADLGGSFFFFLNTHNLSMFIALLISNIIFPLIPAFGGALGIVLSLYMTAFYLCVVREIASGQDDLPTVWIGNLLDDLIIPAFEYMGTWIWVMIPAVLTAIVQGYHDPAKMSIALSQWAFQGVYPSTTVQLVAVIGQFFWPAVVLSVAIGGTFKGLWPHMVIRTALSAPHAYVAIYIALLIAKLIMALPGMPQVTTLVGTANPQAYLALFLVSEVLGIYGMIVAMRVIGLFYRHYKHRFPWAAE